MMYLSVNTKRDQVVVWAQLYNFTIAYRTYPDLYHILEYMIQ